MNIRTEDMVINLKNPLSMPHDIPGKRLTNYLCISHTISIQRISNLQHV